MAVDPRVQAKYPISDSRFLPGVWGGSGPGPAVLSMVLIICRASQGARGAGRAQSPRQVGCSAPRRQDWPTLDRQDKPFQYPLPFPASRTASATLTYQGGARGGGGTRKQETALSVGCQGPSPPRPRPADKRRGLNKGSRAALPPERRREGCRNSGPSCGGPGTPCILIYPHRLRLKFLPFSRSTVFSSLGKGNTLSHSTLVR